jgi:hypothetical protein
MYFYSDEKFKKLFEEIKSNLWESGNKDAFIALDLFSSTSVRTETQTYRVTENFTRFQNM